MTGGAFAELLQARPSGARSWQARCQPIMIDRPASASAKGKTDAFSFIALRLRAYRNSGELGLAPIDLFAGPPPSAAHSSVLQAEKRGAGDEEPGSVRA